MFDVPMKKISLCILLVKMASSVMAQTSLTMDRYEFGRGMNFRDDGGKLLRLSGYLQPYIESKSFTEGGAAAANRFRMRRLRMRLEGGDNSHGFSYRLQADLGGAGEEVDGTSNYLMDAVVNYAATKKINISLGQRAPYTDNRELFMNSNSLQLVERSRLTSAFACIREFGLFVDGTYRLGESHYIKPYINITNGDGQNVFRKDHGGLKYGGRLDYLPFGLFTNFGQFNQVDLMRELTPKLVMGVNYSLNKGVSDRRGRESGTILYLDMLNNELLPDFAKMGFDFLFKYRSFSLLGEFVKTSATVPLGITQRVRTDGTTANTFDVNGVNDMPNYVRSRMMLGQGFNIQMGYLLKNNVSIDVRYTQLKADSFSFMSNGTFYNRPQHFTLGCSKYLSRSYGAKIQGDITYVKNKGGINNNQGLPVTGNEILSRVMVTFSF